MRQNRRAIITDFEALGLDQDKAYTQHDINRAKHAAAEKAAAEAPVVEAPLRSALVELPPQPLAPVEEPGVVDTVVQADVAPDEPKQKRGWGKKADKKAPKSDDGSPAG